MCLDCLLYTSDDEYNTYNINADDAACAIARAVSAEKLAFLTDIEGVYTDPSDKNTLISELTVSDATKLIGCLLYTSCSDTCIHQSDYVLYTYSYVSDSWSFDAGGRGEALLCASYKDEVDGACLLFDVCI